jgi:two-component system sensor histidine kinase ResE
MIGDLLDLARLEGGGGTLEIAPVQTRDLFERVRARHERQAAEAGVTIEVQIDPGADTIAADRTRLEQALQNLAANALRHVAGGGAVELLASLAGRELLMSVRDTGRGIAAEHLPFIFDRFYKVDSSRAASEEGSGLGLSIVKAIVERHGGTITVSSRPDVETVFIIRLPSVADASPLVRSA